MSQNPNSEYNIPTGEYSSDSQGYIREDLKNIYQKIGGNVVGPAYFQSKTERQNNPISDRLYAIADEKSKARARKIELQSNNHAINERNFVKAIAKQLFHEIISPLYTAPVTENSLKIKESEVGATVFGPILPGERREFLNEGPDWFFHQEMSSDSDAEHISRTLHYEVRRNGVLLVGHGFLKNEELDKFVLAAEMSHDRVMSQVYNDHSHGQSAA